MTRRDGDRRLGRVRGRDDLVVARPDDLLARDPIDEPALGGGDHDLVTGGQLVDVEERLAVRRAVAGDRRVAQLARHGCLRIVTRTLLQVALGDTGHDDVVDTDGGHLDAGDRVTLLDGPNDRWRCCRLDRHGVDHRARRWCRARSPRPGRRWSSFRRGDPRTRSPARSALWRSRSRCPTAGTRRTRTSAVPRRSGSCRGLPPTNASRVGELDGRTCAFAGGWLRDVRHGHRS